MSGVSGSCRCQSAKPQLKPHAGGLEFGFQIEEAHTPTLLLQEAQRRYTSGSHGVKQGQSRVGDEG